MSYKNLTPYVTRVVEVYLSSDQTIISDSATLVNFDSIRGDSGHGVSLVSGGNGRIRLSSDSHYYVKGITALDKDSSSAYFSARWYNASGTQLNESDGAFRSYPTLTSSSLNYIESMYNQLIVNPTSDTDYDLKIDGETGSLKADGTFLQIIEMSKT